MHTDEHGHPTRISHSGHHYVQWYGLGALFLAVFLAPVYWPKAFAAPLITAPGTQMAATVALLALCPIAAWCAAYGEPLGRKGRLAVVFVALSATAVCEVVHYWVVDRGHYFSPAQFADNTAWQQFMHPLIVSLDHGALPHSYRFLPDSIVKLFTSLCGDFAVSRIAYRLLFNGLLFVAIYRCARTYVSPLLAGAAVVVTVAIYPITILKYAGQFVDPISHLSFAACLLCLARNYEPGFGPSLLLGLFAKESVIVMAFARAFHGPTLRRALVMAAAYLVAATGVALAIRYAVIRSRVGYGQLSGMGLSHVPENLAGYREWILMYLATFGALLPGAILGWKYLDRPFRRTATTVVVATLGSSILFSWLSEVRNMMPAFIVLAIANMVYLQKRLPDLSVREGRDTSRPTG